MVIIPGVEVNEARPGVICGIAELNVFGSRARGEAAPDSDSDILSTLQPGRLGWEAEQLAGELTEPFGHQVGLVSLHVLHPLLQRPFSRCG